MTISITGGDAAKRAGLDLSRYSDAQLAKIDGTRDNRIEEAEARTAVKIADRDGDGKISKQELLAFDHLLGKDTSAVAKGAYQKLYGAPVAKSILKSYADTKVNAHGEMRKHEHAHMMMAGERFDVLRDAKASTLDPIGAPVPTAPTKVLKAELAALGRYEHLSQAGKDTYARLEAQVHYQELNDTLTAETLKTYGAQEAGRAKYRVAEVEDAAARTMLQGAPSP